MNARFVVVCIAICIAFACVHVAERREHERAMARLQGSLTALEDTVAFGAERREGGSQRPANRAFMNDPAPVRAGDPAAASAVAGAAVASPEEAGIDVAEMARRVDVAFVSEANDAAATIATRRASDAYASRMTDGSTLRSVECRATLCRVEIGHRDEAARSAFAHRQLVEREPMPWNAPVFFAPAHESELSGGASTSVMFVAREGHELPSFEPVD